MSLKFEELEDARWSRIEPLLPPRAWEGKPRADDRSIVNGILFVLVTGCRWIDIPKRYGDDSTANRRLRRWEREGVWKRVMDSLIERGTEMGSSRWRSSRSTARRSRREKGGAHRL